MDANKLSQLIDIFHENRRAGNVSISEIFISKGIEKGIAWKVIHFMPTAFNRIMFASEEISFPSTYILLTGDDTQLKKRFVEEEIFNQSILLAQSKTGKMDGDKWLSVAGRSAKFHVINHLLKSGSQLKDIIFTEMIIDERK
jgi:hypothetical protein